MTMQNIAINNLFSKPLNLHAYPVDYFQGKPLPYPLIQANQQVLIETQQALDEAIKAHPLRLITSTLLYQPNGYFPIEPSFDIYPNVTYLMQPQPNKPQSDHLIPTFFGRLNAQLERSFIPDKGRSFSNKPYQAITKRLDVHYTLMVFIFNKSDYRSLGRETGLYRYLRTHIIEAWCQTIGVMGGSFQEKSQWLAIGEQFELNMKKSEDKRKYNAIHHHLTWLAHRTLGDSPITHWRY
ncbi:YagK/YfjJ domain-containing protein [Vibrio algivorus]|uniref:Inovirus Gp2 family protein n=1 Tax=Vibrio algivorus TaxID=1667024 RepID=A0A557PFK5_9VIBR|nr:inovirus-type Gp2 protein [Vibrio algivorus]TVO39431.1 inovirus Gp2 family protein [Vibrio algivorus]